MVHIVAGVGSNGRQGTNRYLAPFVAGLLRRGHRVELGSSCKDPELARAAIGAVLDKVEMDRASVTFAANGAGTDWDSTDAYLPEPGADKETVLRGLYSGGLVLQNTAEPNLEALLDEFDVGYLRNSESGWHAKLFEPAIFVADSRKLELSLGCTINPRAIILNHGRDGAGSRVRLGRASHIGADALLNLGPTDFSVGNFTLISANFAVHGMRHSLSHVSSFAIGKGPFAFFGATYEAAEPVRIGHDVWIGEGVKCLSGVEIPNGCVVGAGTIVTRSLEPYGVYAGNPARLLRHRFDPDKIAFINDLGWWDFNFKRLCDIQESFRKPIADMSMDELQDLF